MLRIFLPGWPLQDTDQEDDLLAEELDDMVDAESCPGSVKRRVTAKSPSHWAIQRLIEQNDDQSKQPQGQVSRPIALLGIDFSIF